MNYSAQGSGGSEQKGRRGKKQKTKRKGKRFKAPFLKSAMCTRGLVRKKKSMIESGNKRKMRISPQMPCPKFIGTNSISNGFINIRFYSTTCVTSLTDMVER